MMGNQQKGELHRCIEPLVDDIKMVSILPAAVYC